MCSFAFLEVILFNLLQHSFSPIYSDSSEVSLFVGSQQKSSEQTFKQQVEMLKLQHELQVKQKILELEQELARKK